MIHVIVPIESTDPHPALCLPDCPLTQQKRSASVPVAARPAEGRSNHLAIRTTACHL
jgi:hypothetical protein